MKVQMKPLSTGLITVMVMFVCDHYLRVCESLHFVKSSRRSSFSPRGSGSGRRQRLVMNAEPGADFQRLQLIDLT
jgi:hypothetical protein